MNAPKHYLRYGAQALGSILILGCAISNGIKLVALLALWALTFGRLTRKEGIAFIVICAFFTGMDIGSIQNGVFTFVHPDVAGLPVWEFFMFGFLVLHTMRMLEGPLPKTSQRWLVVLFLVAFATPFLTTARSEILLLETSVILLLAIVFFHEKSDFHYMVYWVFFGAIWEYVGVERGIWTYPHPPAGGVPLWFVTMWGGIGLFTRRLVYPLVFPDRLTVTRL